MSDLFSTSPNRSTQLCAVSKDVGDSCNGDSGGPLMHRDPASGAITVFGVTSQGSKWCDSHVPGLYTRVRLFADWIASQMNVQDV